MKNSTFFRSPLPGARGFYRKTTVFWLAGLAAIAVGAAFIPRHAAAIPSFARQTGMECNACHTAYPQLTALGRQFKLNSFSMSDGSNKYPPIAFMAQPSFTHTQKSQPGGAAPHFGDNNNFALSQASIFYGGKIYGRLGAFAQFTYSGVDRRFSIDNTDIRWSGEGDPGGADLVYGLTLNNNPAVEDMWNTTPAWGFPYAGSDLAPGPAAATLIEGGLGQQVIGLGAYADYDNLLYGQVAGYRQLSDRTQTTLGISPEGEDQLHGTMPYWRFAVEHDWGNNYLSLGTFGLVADTYPGRDKSSGTDRRRDLGLDSEYQYSGDKQDVTVLLRWTHENADYNAGVLLGNTDNAKDTLRSLNATVSYLYDKTYGLDLGYVATTGTADATLYGSATGSPDTNQYTVQFDYLPFNRDGGPSAWPWFNPKLIVQYTGYTKFDGSKKNYDGAGRDAIDNNTLYVMVWTPF